MALTVLASFAAWAVPGESLALRGFGEREPATIPALLVLACWYLLSVAAASTGFHAGIRTRAVRPHATGGGDRDDARFVGALTVIATIGVGWVFVQAGGFGAFVDAFSTSTANALKEATGEQAGLSTLRYTAAISAPAALHRFLTTRKGLLSTVWNAVLLLIVASIASRLSLMLAVTVFVVLALSRPAGLRLRARIVVPIAAVVLALLTFFNYTRNATYYRSHGVTDAFQANVFEILAYLGTPFQVSLGVADHIVTHRHAFADAPGEPWLLFVPEFLRPEGAEARLTGPRYEGSVDVRQSLTTNSAFADTLAQYGFGGLACVLIMLGLAGYMIGYFLHEKSYVVITSGVLMYAMADFWRIFLLDRGIIVYTALLPIVLAAVVAALPRRDQERSPS